MSSFKEKMFELRRNPSLMQYLVFEELDKSLNKGGDKYDIPDASFPFAYAMECGVMETAMAIDEMESISRTLFPKLALEHGDLYRHMSDDDYIGRFASPSKTNFELLLSYEDIIVRAIPYGDNGNRKLVIPRFTEFRLSDIPFTMQHPIIINVSAHNGINIIYDSSVNSPITTLKTNIVDWQMLLIDKKKVVSIKIPVNQMRLETYTDSLSPSTLFETNYKFADRFFYARAYIDKGNGWEELYTTHSDLVYDPLKVTVVFKVIGDKLHVSIPTIYTNLGMVKGSLRIDIYTTLGEFERDLGTYKASQFNYKLNDIDDDITFVSPLRTFSLAQPLAREVVSGGYNNISIQKLRDRVINNTLGPSSVPITNVQLEDAVDRKGYSLVSNIDDITNRQFLATKKLGKLDYLDAISGPGLAMAEWILNMDNISKSSHVYDNDETITIKPSMLYRLENGRVFPLDDSIITRLLGSSSEAVARDTLNNNYVYSPFHTVLDSRDNTFEARPYYLDKPEVNEKLFVMDNPSSNLQATISDYTMEKTNDGFRLYLEIEMSEKLAKINPNQIIVQCGYQPQGETSWASVNGNFISLTDKKGYFSVDIKTNHDIDRNGRMSTSNMSMFSTVQNRFRIKLKESLEISIIVNDIELPTYEANRLDDLVQTHLLSNRFMTVVRERLIVTLGYDLSKLWRRSRTILGPESYQLWENDVLDYYEADVFELDETGNIKLSLDSSGNIVYNKLHSKGEPKLDTQGNQLKRYFKSQPKLDKDGNLIPLGERKLNREITMLMVDGLYYLGSDVSVEEARKDIPMTLVSWLNNDIDGLNEQLLELAEIYLYPTNTMGLCKVLTNDGLTITIPVEQTLSLVFHLTKMNYNNPTLRPSIIEAAKDVIDEHFDKRTIATSDIISKMKNVLGDSVLAIDINGLGGTENNLDVLTIIDDAVRLTVKKKLQILSNSDTTIVDDIQITFKQHD